VTQIPILSMPDDDFERRFVGQGVERRSIEQTLDLAWELLARFPGTGLKRIKPQHVERYHHEAAARLATQGASRPAWVRRCAPVCAGVPLYNRSCEPCSTIGSAGRRTRRPLVVVDARGAKG
jgi:hypothetical protein